jgi:hypothetical protein
MSKGLQTFVLVQFRGRYPFKEPLNPPDSSWEIAEFRVASGGLPRLG